MAQTSPRKARHVKHKRKHGTERPGGRTRAVPHKPRHKPRKRKRRKERPAGPRNFSRGRRPAGRFFLSG